MTKHPLSAIKVAGSEISPLSETHPLELACGPGGCSSICCKNGPPIILNPYEVSTICAQSGMSYEDFLDIAVTDRAEGFPLVMLPRDPVCYFWTESGCRIYKARPLACRLFPLGRVFQDDRSYFVLPGRNLCSGLANAPRRTVADYLRSQDASLYIKMADRWIEFVSDIERLPLPDAPVTSIAFHMLVYSPDTPPAVGRIGSELSLEDRFLLRLDTAQKQLPCFLGRE